jgi:PAS domain S-box-containing protein
MLSKSAPKFWAVIAIMSVFFLIKAYVVLTRYAHRSTNAIIHNHNTLELICFVLFIPILYGIYIDIVNKNREIKATRDYYIKLNEMIVEQSNNDVFFDGDTPASAKSLINGISKSLSADRVSIWLYDDARNSIILEYLYKRADGSYLTGATLHKRNYSSYFRALQTDPIIVANDAATHKATSCFKDNYLGPLGIKSMLDVPIWHNGNVIGVICTESLTGREWTKEEIDFAQIMSSFYSFAHSVRENMSLYKNHKEIERFIDAATLVSKTDPKGNITYVNKKFEQVSGWSLKEIVGKNHRILSSGEHPIEFWERMYKVTGKQRKIWNSIVTNVAKNGSIFYVDTYVKAEFDPETNDLLGYTSIRQDVTDIIKAAKEIEKKNTYLEHAAKILRHDMHSGINTYIPRGVSSLERRLTLDQIAGLKIEAPIKMIKEGLRHTQRVYRGVYEFTNLVKPDTHLEKKSHDIRSILEEHLTSTAYKHQVIIDDLGFVSVNEPLFCTAIDNLIRNGLRYNDSDNKLVTIRRHDDLLLVQDNGRGLSASDFKKYSQPYSRRKEQKEAGTGLGLNICIAILEEHGFSVSCDKLETGGTLFKINIKERT